MPGPSDYGGWLMFGPICPVFYLTSTTFALVFFAKMVDIYIITDCINVLIQCVTCPWTPSCFQLIWGLVWDI